jgi:hypothetical protein
MSRSLGLLLLFAACEQGYTVEGNVTFAADRPTTGTLMICLDFLDAPVASWTPIALDRGANFAADPDDSYDMAPFGRAPNAIYAAAFIDLDGDGTLGTGEPYGEFTGNPIVDLGYGMTTADVVIDSVAP